MAGRDGVEPEGAGREPVGLQEQDVARDEPDTGKATARRLARLGLLCGGDLGQDQLRRTLDDQRPVVEAFARGIVDGIRLFRSDPTAAKQSMGQHMDLTDPPLLDWTYDAVVADGLISRPFVDVAQMRAVLEALLPEQPDLAQLALDRVIDSSVMETLDRQGYLPPP